MFPLPTFYEIYRRTSLRFYIYVILHMSLALYLTRRTYVGLNCVPIRDTRKLTRNMTRESFSSITIYLEFYYTRFYSYLEKLYFDII